MHRVLFALTFVILSHLSFAQMQVPPRTQRAIVDPANLIDDRGATLEIYPTKRAIPIQAIAGQPPVHRVIHSAKATPISGSQLGVIFNHAMQAEGYITGEIAFKLKTGDSPAGFDAASYPGFAHVTGADVYEVVARTPQEYVDVFKRLKVRSDVEWVEPIVNYGAAAQSSPAPHKTRKAIRKPAPAGPLPSD
jgi:hypothetical protein